MAGLSCVAMSAWAEGRISSVEIETRSSGLDVVVSGTDLTKPKELRILNGESYIVEFDAKLDVKGFRRRMPLPNVSVIEVGWYSANPPKVRVHLRLLPTESPRLVQQEGKWVIRLGSDPAPAQMPTVLPATRATEERTPFPSTVPPLKPAEVLGNAQGNLKPDEAGPKPILPPTRTPAQTPARTPVQTPSQNPAPAQNAAPAPNPVRTTTQAEKRVNLDFVG
ncbi:MAG: hypothetical protein MH204_00975, partial [Fimbriimonadaceae bacterium]|nr:hypothetical protein [Fimbriimonadaceae bacterium]